jgi:hypothetical protein
LEKHVVSMQGQSCSLAGFSAPVVDKANLAEKSETAVSRDRTTSALIAAYNAQAGAVKSVTAGVEILPTAGPSYGAEANQPHEVGALLLAQRPASLRIMADAPFAPARLFDLASDGTNFQMLIPSRHQFLIGLDASEGHSPKAIENLRPRHVMDAVIWPMLAGDAVVRPEDGPASKAAAGAAYALRVMRKRGNGWEVERTIYLNRETLRIQGLEIYGAQEHVLSRIRYAQWAAVPAESGGVEGSCFPRHIWIERPEEDYRLEIVITRLGLNREIARESFHLMPMAGVRLIYLEAANSKP